MNKHRWERVKRLFERARPLPREERRGFLLRECRGDDSVVSEVLQMLEREEGVGGFLDPPVDEDLALPLQSAAASLDGVQLGDFQILETIGRGAMGVVYLARQARLGRNVAVKVLAQHLCSSPERQERFRREALAASRLRHPNIVTIIAFGEDKGLRYIAMEYVAGKSLLEVLRHDPQGSIDPVAAARIILGIARALEHCHELGIIHRDIKPHNVLLDDRGEPRLVDFGLAKDIDLDSISQAGSIAGTPHYMSPEQAQALGSEIDHRTDIYSAGAVLYELLTGHRPFEAANSPAVLYRITHEKPRSIAEFAPKVPKALTAICMKAMGRRPENRYPSARALAQDLERFLAGERVRAPRPTLVRQAYESVFYGHPKAAAIAAVVLFTLVVFLTPRAPAVLAASRGDARTGVARRSNADVLVPPSRDEAVLQPWRKMVKAVIDDAQSKLPDTPVYHDD